MEKITNKTALEFVLGLEEVQNNSEICEKLKAMLVQVNKKSTGGKNGKAQEEQKAIMEKMVEVMQGLESSVQIKDLQAMDTELMEYTGQRLSALMKKLVENGIVEKIVEKRVSTFRLIKEEVISEEIEQIEE